MASLRAQPLTAEGQFNWVFLIEVLVIGILSLFFLFYFNRVFAATVSYAIRAYTWRKHKAYIDISALQISLLGGRIFFKSIRYHAHNVTVYVYEGNITWRYWLRLVQVAEVFQEEDLSSSGKQRSSSPPENEKESLNDNDEKTRTRSRSIGKEEKASTKPKKELPCRIAVKVAGVEAFIYNRSPLYDGIVEATLGKSKDVFSEDSEKEGVDSPTSPNSSGSDPKVEVEHTPTRTTTASASPPAKPEIPSFLRLFPIKIDCKRAAAAVGNENTTNVLVAKAEKSAGTVDAGHAGPLDLWKLLFNFGIENVDVTMKPNRDFKEFQLDAAQRLLREKQLHEPHRPEAPVVKAAHRAHGVWAKLKRMFKQSRSSADSIRTASMQSGDDKPGNPLLDQLPGPGQWHGLMRYLDDDADADEHDEWRKVEYAKASQLVECPKVTMRFYWDMSGPVPESAIESRDSLGSMHLDDINGSAPPEYGMDLGVHGGFVVYGPWADRQRLNLQSVFFPAACVDAVPAKQLNPGDLRVCTVFKIAVIVEEDVVLRIPAREESKDPRWKGRAENAAKPPDEQGNNGGKSERRRWGRSGKRRKGKKGTAAVDARPYAWLDVTVKKDSVVNYVMDMFPRPTGYRNSLDLDVKGLEMSSSVNHGLLWRSGPLTLDADISQPIAWNSLRKWPFNIVVQDLELFILRDHLFLIIDLVNDWASGAPSDFYTFVPYNYQINLVFNNFIMYLNVNECNIINDPADFDKNDFITLEGQISANLGIPMENYRPKRNGITFDVLGEDLRMRMLSPPKSTFNAFVQDKTMAELPKFTLKGSHNANQEAKVGNVDVLRMDIVGTGLSLKAYGFFVRQLVNLKENYFGDYMHFKTLEEFQGASDDLEEANAMTASFPKPTSINELDVILCIVAEQATVMFPTNLYSCKEFVRVELPRADVDLRIASYYLDLGLQLSPLSFLSGATASGDEEDDDLANQASNTQFFVAHVDLNGHRAFGLPPNEDAYVSQWDIDIGKVTGELSSVFVRDLALAGRAFAFCISDDENALPVSSPAVALDAGFVQVRTDTVRLWLHVGKDALLFSTEPITVDTSDWANETFSQRITVLVPQITIACIDGRSASRNRIAKHRKRPVKTYAFFQTGLSLDVVGRKLHFDLETKRQQSHFRLHDQRTNRFPFLIRSSIDAPIKEEDDLLFEPPAMPYPPMPPPVTMAELGSHRPPSLKSDKSLAGGRRLSSKSSTSSLAASLRAGRASAYTRPVLQSRATERSTGGTSASFHSFRASSRSSSHSHGPLSNDTDRAKFGLPSSTVAFASSYSEPYFPLEMVEPDETNVPSFSNADDTDSESSHTSSTTAVMSSPDLDDDCEHSSIMIKIIPGIRGYVSPRVAVTASKLIREVLPHNPDEVMDAFQMGVMGTIQSQNAERHGVKRILEIQAELPTAHLRVAIEDEQEDHVADQLDLTLSQLVTSVRIRTRPVDSGPTESLALHTLLSGLDISLVNRETYTEVIPAVRFSLDEALVWMGLSSMNSFHAYPRTASLMVDGSQAKYLTALALKLVPVVNGLKRKFEGIFDLDLRRLQLLTHVLTQHGEHIGDPAFMARMVYILRAFPLHFRNTDSWKIIARFRYILQNLPQDARDELERDFKEANGNHAERSSVKAVESWTQWRNWDVPYVTQTIAFKTLCRPDEVVKLDDSEINPATMTFRTDLLRVGIQHSEGNNDISFEDLSLGVENSPPIKPEGLMLVDENKRTKTTLQMHTSSIALSFDWALYRVAEDVLAFNDRFRELATHMEPSQSRTASQAFEDGLSRHDFNVVFSTDTGSISLQTTNLRHVSRADGLKLSVIATTQANEEYGQCVSAILNFDTAVTELHGPNARIWQTLVTTPSLYVDHLQAAKGVDMPPTVTLALAYEDLQVVVNEQIPGILHIIETVIVEEVAQVQRLVLSLSPNTPAPQVKPRQASEVSTASSAPKFHIGLLAGNINFEFSLLQALSYQLEGTAASFRLAPSLSHDNQFSIDFDVGRQNHALVNTSGNDRHTQGILEFPPMNGRVGMETTDDRTSISVGTTIEKIEIDAAALQGIIGVINQPEVESVISAIKSGVQDVQAQIAELYPADAEVRRQKKEAYHETAFDVRFALLGIRVAAVTPGSSRGSMAEIEFGVGPVHATASNRGSDMRAKSLIPEVRANIQDIGASLYVKEKGKTLHRGNATLSIGLNFTCKDGEQGLLTRELNVRSNALDINIYPETASIVVDVINHLQDRIKHLDLSKEVDYLRRLRDKRKDTVMCKIRRKQGLPQDQEMPFSPEDLLSIKTNIQLNDIKACWLIDPSFAPKPRTQVDDLIFSIQSVQFATRGVNEARLTILDMQLQLAKKETSKQQRALNSALLPEIGFSVAYWSEGKSRSLAFKASGKPLDLRLESKFMFPVTAAQRSIELAIEKFKKGTATWKSTPTSTGAPRGISFDTKKVTSLLVEADFAGAQVYLQGSANDKSLSSLAASASQRQGATHGRYGQFAAEGTLMHTTLTAPGIAFKMEYNSHESHEHRPTVNGELRIDASSNMLLPNVVPLILEVTNSVKDVMQSNKQASHAVAAKVSPPENKATQKFFEEESIANADPSRFFGKTKVDLGFRICKQEFGLTCQPIARVDAKASLDDIYITMNTIDSDEHGHFFAMSAVVTKLKAEVQHVYSKEPTFSFDMDSVVLSAMNNKHLSGTPGVSAILNINPTRIVINGKQLQDLLLFREIWLPPEIRNAAAAASASASSAPPPAATSSTKADDFFVQRYQSVASAAAFPWNATVSITKLAVDLDLGQSIGKSSFTITNLWASQQKSSNWEQNLCVGLDEMAVNSTGRMSGFVQLGKLGVRTSIKWPKVAAEDTARTTPLIQASVGFQKLKAKAAFDYQAFAFADIESFDFLMYNVRDAADSADRLVAVLDCEKAYVFCTSNSPAQAVGLYQAFDRLVQEKQASHVQSLKDIEKHIRRESTVVPTRFGPNVPQSPLATIPEKKTSITLHTDVVVTMGNICFGIYPSTFFDSQMLKVEASNIQARFAVGLERGRLTSGLGMTLGQLQVALSAARKVSAVPKALDVSVEDVINNALNAKGGTILRVPKVVASMQTWQTADSNNVDYIFKSLFDGKIDVGWNLSRINFIKGMWTSHSRALASRLGKSLPESAVKITAGPQNSEDAKDGGSPDAQQEKITAEINLPQSRYEYHALEPPIIETPQLRDLGEATPSLHWIGLDKDRLPNFTHQIVIVSLLEVCKEVQDAYGKILGSS